MEGLSFNAWMIDAADAHLEGSSARAATPEAAARRLLINERKKKKDREARGRKPRRKKP